MTNLLDLLAADPNIAPEFRRIAAELAPELDGVGIVGSPRWREVRDQEHADHQREERKAAIERGD